MADNNSKKEESCHHYSTPAVVATLTKRLNESKSSFYKQKMENNNLRSELQRLEKKQFNIEIENLKLTSVVSALEEKLRKMYMDFKEMKREYEGKLEMENNRLVAVQTIMDEDSIRMRARANNNNNRNSKAFSNNGQSSSSASSSSSSTPSSQQQQHVSRIVQVTYP